MAWHQVTMCFDGPVYRTVTPVDEFFAHKLRDAMKGAGTDDATLIRIVASQVFVHSC